jgi:two-component system sensor histidine kinase VicK
MNSLLVKDEALRIEALNQYEVLTAVSDPVLDDLTRLAAQVCDTPIAAISLIGSDRICLKSRIGIHTPELSLGSTPCETTILGDSVYELTDARQDPDFAPQGILIDGRDLRFYAGAPLTTPGGISIGALFVLDTHPRRLTIPQSEALAILSRQVIIRFELSGRIRQIDRAARSRQRVESALTVERNFVSAVLDTVAALVAVYDTAGRIVRFNRACELASGYDFNILVGRYPWDKLIPEEDLAEAVETFDRLRSGDVPIAFENRWLNRDGTIHRIAWSATALTDAQGEVAFIIATGIDVTVQRAAETTLRESEARYRQLVEGSLGMVCTHDLNGVLLSVNTHGAETIGHTVDQVVGRSLTEFMPKQLRRSFRRYVNQILASGEAQGLLHLSHRNGEVRVIAFHNKLIDIPGRNRYILGFGVDISEQVRAEGRVRTLTRQSDSILESVGDGIYGIDLEGRVTVVNSAAAQMLGYKSHELLGRHLHDTVHHTRADGTPYPDGECPITNSLRNLTTVRISDEVFWRKDGTSFPVEYVARPQIDSTGDGDGSGKAVGVVVAFTDTTERRALDRMKDEFISTVSHELRTPLTSLRAALGLVSGGALVSRPEKMHQMLEIALGNTDRLVRLVNDILDLERISSGKSELQLTMCSAEDLLMRAAALQHAAATKANIGISCSTDNIPIWCDPDRILQTLTNLISNAIKFSPSGSEIQLRARTVDDVEAEIEVQDFGRGIPEDKLEHIFERFQQVDASDSRAMGGTGLGLAICRSIIAQHGGRIWATSKPAQSTTFHLTLPTKPSVKLR